MERETGDSYATLAGLNTASYDLFFCAEPGDEPTCEPTRPGEYEGSTASDIDGDGVDNGLDNCPEIFNPVRTFDDGEQADGDEDGVGDVCDPCPLDAGVTTCTPPDPYDRDGDGVADDGDNCPLVANAEQEDADGDNVGDACDACPYDSNLDGAPCPESIYAIKRGEVAAGEAVLVTGVVTALQDPAFFLQVPEVDHEADGYRWSGLYVYVSPSQGGITVPQPGDFVEVWGTVADFFGQTQLASVTNVDVLLEGADIPAAVTVAPAAVATDGSDAWAYEGVLLHVDDEEVTSVDPTAHSADDVPIGEYVLADSLRVNDFLYLTDPFPVVGERLSVTGVLHFSYDDSKLEPRGPADVQWESVVLPGLVSFGPDPVYVDEGAVEASSTPPLEITIDRLAPAGGVPVALSDDGHGHVGVAATVLVPEGSDTVEVPLSGLVASEAPVTITATLNGTSLEAGVLVVAADREAAPVTVTPAADSVVAGAALDVEVTLDIPAPAGTTLDVVASPLGLLSVPATVAVPEDAVQITFEVLGQAVGEATLTVSTDAGSADADIDVVEAPALGLVLSEVLYDAPDDDNGLEWIEIYNGMDAAIDLSAYSIGAGGTDYTYLIYALSGTIPAGGCWVIGGPTSSELNGEPVFDLAGDFPQDLQNAGSATDGVALFALAAGDVTALSVPLDAVLYDSPNNNGLLDETGAIGAPDVDDAPAGSSIERGPGGWQVQSVPTPNDCSPLF